MLLGSLPKRNSLFSQSHLLKREEEKKVLSFYFALSQSLQQTVLGFASLRTSQYTSRWLRNGVSPEDINFWSCGNIYDLLFFRVVSLVLVFFFFVLDINPNPFQQYKRSISQYLLKQSITFFILIVFYYVYTFGFLVIKTHNS